LHAARGAGKKFDVFWEIYFSLLFYCLTFNGGIDANFAINTFEYEEIS